MLNILIVDDENDIRRLYENYLVLFGFNDIFTAQNGKEAIEFVKKSNPKPNIILMDYSMPVLDGLKATREILKFDNETFIILMSVDEAIRDLALNSGGHRFYYKNSPMELLIKNLEEIKNQYFN